MKMKKNEWWQKSQHNNNIVFFLCITHYFTNTMACNFFTNLFSTCFSIDDPTELNVPVTPIASQQLPTSSGWNGPYVSEETFQEFQRIQLDDGDDNNDGDNDQIVPVLDADDGDDGDDGDGDADNQIVTVFNGVQETYVLRGKYMMFHVQRGAINMNREHWCRVIEIPPSYMGSLKRGSIIRLLTDEFEKPSWYEHIQDDIYNQHCIDALNHLRIASWNVRCAVPFGAAQNINHKIDMIAEVICKSECDVIALQEMPSIVNAGLIGNLSTAVTSNPDLIGNLPTFWFQIEKMLLDALRLKSLEEWGSEATEVFYDPPLGNQGPNRNTHAFIYKKSKLRCSGSQRILDPNFKNQTFQRTPVLGYFHNIRFAGNGKFTLCNLHLKPSNAETEVRRIGYLIPQIKSHSIGELIFLGDLNIGSQTPRCFKINSRVRFTHTNAERIGTVVADRPAIGNCTVREDNGVNRIINKAVDNPAQLRYVNPVEQEFHDRKYSNNSDHVDANNFLPTPGENTWDEFVRHNYIPCIKDVFTNSALNRSFDNIWITETLDGFRPRLNPTDPHSPSVNTTTVRLNLSNEGERPLTLTPRQNFLRGVYQVDNVSDHSLVFADIKLNEQFSTEIHENIVPRPFHGPLKVNGRFF